MEVYHDRQWGTICDENWGNKAAELVCKELGYSGAMFAVKKAHFGNGTGPVCNENRVFLSWRLALEWPLHHVPLFIQSEVKPMPIVCARFSALCFSYMTLLSSGFYWFSVLSISFVIDQLKGGFPLSRNFYVRTDVNFNWLYVRK